MKSVKLVNWKMEFFSTLIIISEMSIKIQLKFHLIQKFYYMFAFSNTSCLVTYTITCLIFPLFYFLFLKVEIIFNAHELEKEATYYDL